MWDILIEQSFTGTRPAEALGRMLSAIVLGGIIGFERALHARTAGLRTHILVSLASCLFALLTFEIHARFQDEALDPLRLISAVTSGVAFLAAGSIIVSGGKLVGMTTGAGLWLAGAIGMACGIGSLALAMLATFTVLPVLWLLRSWAHRMEKGALVDEETPAESETRER